MVSEPPPRQQRLGELQQKSRYFSTSPGAAGPRIRNAGRTRRRAVTATQAMFRRRLAGYGEMGYRIEMPGKGTPMGF